MKNKVILIPHLLLYSYVCFAQNSIEACVLDDNTGKPLYGVNILSDSGLGTITNSEGCFVLDICTDKTIKVSHLGFHTQAISIDTIPAVIRLKPSVYELSPAYLTAIKIDSDSLTSSIFKKMKSSLKDIQNTGSTYFYRQTSLCDTVCYELVESFFSAHNLYGLKQLSLIKGRIAELPGDSTYIHLNMTNMFSLSQASFIKETKPQKGKNVIPFICPVPTSKYYDVDVWLFEEENGNEVYIINFNPKKDISESIEKGSIYMDAKTSSILHFSSECIMPFESTSRKLNGVLTTYVDYLPEKDIPVVNYVKNTLCLRCTHPGTNKEHIITINSLMSKVNIPLTMDDGKKLKWTDDLHTIIQKSTYDADFWKNNPVVKRTELEETAIRMFESKQLLGSFQ